MKFFFRLIVLLITFASQISSLNAQNRLDSLLQERDSQYSEYNQFKLSMDERTWIKLVELSNKANVLIETDNLLLKQYLQREISLNQQLHDEIEKLNLEIALLNKEAQMQEILSAEKRNLINISLMALGGITILLIVLVILFIDRQTRYRSARLEIERLWSAKDGPKYNHLQQDELKMLSERVNKLTDENDKLKQDLNKEQGKKSEAMDSLKQEIRTRRQVEQEIKDLISQIKKK